MLLDQIQKYWIHPIHHCLNDVVDRFILYAATTKLDIDGLTFVMPSHQPSNDSKPMHIKWTFILSIPLNMNWMSECLQIHAPTPFYLNKLIFITYTIFLIKFDHVCSGWNYFEIHKDNCSTIIFVHPLFSNIVQHLIFSLSLSLYHIINIDKCLIDTSEISPPLWLLPIWHFFH